MIRPIDPDVVVMMLRTYGWADIGFITDDAWRAEHPTVDRLGACGNRLWDGTADQLHRRGEIRRLFGNTDTAEPEWFALACAPALDLTVPGYIARRGEPHA